jgi:hypothetical protein
MARLTEAPGYATARKEIQRFAASGEGLTSTTNTSSTMRSLPRSSPNFLCSGCGRYTSRPRHSRRSSDRRVDVRETVVLAFRTVVDAVLEGRDARDPVPQIPERARDLRNLLGCGVGLVLNTTMWRTGSFCARTVIGIRRRTATRKSRQPPLSHRASGSGRSCSLYTLLVVPLPPSMWNGARVLIVAHRPRPFHPPSGSSIRPSTHLV